jgi:colicin import membrane protein
MSAALLTPSRQAPALPAFGLALATHCLLFALLFFGIRWQSAAPAAVEAELWRELPRVDQPLAQQERRPDPSPPRPAEAPNPAARQEALPRLEPVPQVAPPPKPEIAVRDEKPKPREKPPAPADKAANREAPKDAKPSDDPIARELEKERIRRELLAATRDSGEQRAAAEAAARATRLATEWAERVRAGVRSRIPTSVANAVIGNPEAVFEVTLLAGREVDRVRLVRPSGNAAYDEAAERAIRAASPLPAPPEGVAQQRTLTLRMRPKDE